MQPRRAASTTVRDGETSTEVASQKHVPALDGLRGLAILLVLAHDYNLVESDASRLARLLGVVLDAGWLGVQLFFVLSGYLITGILLDTRNAKGYWRAFLGRRALRIFPLYYAVLFAAFVVAPLLGHPPAGIENQIWFWTYLSNWAEPFGRSVSVFPHFWSLSIEEQFYLFWPLVVRRLSPRALGAACFGLVAVALASRMVVRPTAIGEAAAYMFTVCRVDALALGALGALLVRSARAREAFVTHRTRLRLGALALFVLTVLATRGAPRTGVSTQSFGYTDFALVFVVLVVDAVLAPKSDRLLALESWAPLRAVGRYSYAMYVFHTPLHVLVGLPLVTRLTGGHAELGIGASLGYVVLASATTFAAAWLSYHLLEKHFLALKRRFQPSSPTANQIPLRG
ncbi:MAG: hypothetical protein K0S65_4383 [Labilithrix sp.]|nr:hypothetical protein [Labilithrix sp.]